MKKILITILLLAMSIGQCFSAGCGGLFTSGLKLDAVTCNIALKERTGKLPLAGSCTDLLQESERVNAYFEDHDISAEVSCTPQTLHEMRDEMAFAASVLIKARDRGWGNE